MSQTKRAYLAATVAGFTIALSVITPASAYSDVLQSDCQSSKTNPTMTFDKGTAPYGNLYTYYSSAAYCGSQLMATRRKVTMKAGSGDGTSNDCTSNKGWLPNGSYTPRYEVNHQTSSTVVKGSVWNLGNKLCSAGTVTRTELFIHSQGGNGGSWTESNYKSAGCIKINQTDRTYLKSLYDQPVYGSSSTKLTVTS
ncbi:hypothetical protein [Micromonospora zhanjiangensis]|uniref:L,D-transpeptidase catalytic domain n=1 Tax=Micromonospora zhanjiangensis TaxID=1522057 RepID=A0ABV8KVP3_9ACTN